MILTILLAKSYTKQGRHPTKPFKMENIGKLKGAKANLKANMQVGRKDVSLLALDAWRGMAWLDVAGCRERYGACADRPLHRYGAAKAVRKKAFLTLGGLAAREIMPNFALGAKGEEEVEDSGIAKCRDSFFF